ncbi:MAG: site-specific integrase [Bacteroidia bacterium]|nr:site-specific integrase [Bacteroidia bacterium]
MRTSVTTAIYLDKRRSKKDLSYPIKLRVTYQRQQKYYGIGYSLTEEEFEKATSLRPRGIYKDYQLEFAAQEERALDIIAKIEKFTFAEFEKRWKSKRKNPKNVYQAFEAYISDLTKEGRIRTAETYRCSLISLQKFSGRKRLNFSEIHPDWLKEYEKWMLDQDKSISTVGIYLRNLRALFNQAIEKGELDQDFYPFGKHKYQIPQSRNVKKALSLEGIKLIVQYQAEPGSQKARYKDYWLFSYLCNGINIKDMALLRYKNIEDNRITFIREKTKNATRRNQKPIIVAIIPMIQQIIDRWGNKQSKENTFIFPILKEGLSQKEQTAYIKQETKQINKYIRRIGKEVGIKVDITTYSARHSFSTILKRSGASIEFISESLGHTNLTTTERYLDSFEDETRRGFAEKLLDF